MRLKGDNDTFTGDGHTSRNRTGHTVLPNAVSAGHLKFTPGSAVRAARLAELCTCGKTTECSEAVGVPGS